MIFSIKTVDQQGQCRSFSYNTTELEDGLDVLTNIVRMGHPLLSGELFDEGRRIQLPIEAIDCQPIAIHLRKLGIEWQAALSKPVDRK